MNRTLIIILLSLVATACQNDGHIGRLFGTWSLTEMTRDGSVPEGFASEATTWSFQNNIIRVVLNGEHQEWTDRTGTWEERSTNGHHELLIYFTHSDNDTPAGTGPYKAPEWLGFPENKVVALEYQKDTSREMVLNYVDPEGVKYTYTLKKTW